MSQKIVTHLWYDKEAREAATFYTTIFANLASPSGGSKVENIVTIPDTPSLLE